jgi:hypothetical protein
MQVEALFLRIQTVEDLEVAVLLPLVLPLASYVRAAYPYLLPAVFRLPSPLAKCPSVKEELLPYSGLQIHCLFRNHVLLCLCHLLGRHQLHMLSVFPQ